jgi:DnaJ-domain-containing protein 1
MLAQFFAEFVAHLAFGGPGRRAVGSLFGFMMDDSDRAEGEPVQIARENYRPPPFERTTYVDAPPYYERLLTLNDVVGVLNKRYPVKLAQCALPLVVDAAKADGNFSTLEREFVRASAHRLFDDAVAGSWIDDMIEVHSASKLQNDQRVDFLRELSLFANEVERWAVLQVCAAVMWRDGVVSPAEHEFVAALGRDLRLPAELVTEMIDPPIKEPEPETPPVPQDERSVALLVLGLSATCTAEDIEERFKVLALKLHPDRMVHADPTTRETATKRFVEVNAAYQSLKK